MENGSCCVFPEAVLDTVLPPVLIAEFVLGLIGNSVGLWMFFFHMKTWKPNSIYLLNLAMADTVVMFCLPFRTDYYMRGKNWVYGDIPCRILLFMLAANRAAGIFFLTAVAVDRYLKIVHPLNKINKISLKQAVLASCGLWLLIVAMTAYLLGEPHFFIQNNKTQCESFNICPGTNPTATWHNAFYVIQFLVPVCIISYSTIRITWQLRSKTIDKHGKIKRAVQFVMAVAIVFAICFFPSSMSRISVWILKAQYSECSYFRQANLAFYTSVCFTYFNSVLNPVVYYFSSPSFSGLFKNLFNKITGKEAEMSDEQVNTCSTMPT
ncbi:HCAR2 protein, partial [Polypterus senegalus]|nr:hydroxycarboxylic acid receptor 2-like [Polypterus senegalus]MBN3289976.1 HCAR2 protein [Polypterus senegalus]